MQTSKVCVASPFLKIFPEGSTEHVWLSLYASTWSFSRYSWSSYLVKGDTPQGLRSLCSPVTCRPSPFPAHLILLPTMSRWVSPTYVFRLPSLTQAEATWVSSSYNLWGTGWQFPMKLSICLQCNLVTDSREMKNFCSHKNLQMDTYSDSLHNNSN